MNIHLKNFEFINASDMSVEEITANSYPMIGTVISLLDRSTGRKNEFVPCSPREYTKEIAQMYGRDKDEVAVVLIKDRKLLVYMMRQSIMRYNHFELHFENNLDVYENIKNSPYVGEKIRIVGIDSRNTIKPTSRKKAIYMVEYFENSEALEIGIPSGVFSFIE